MHETSIFWLRIAAGCYAVGLLYAILIMFRRGGWLTEAALVAFQLGLVIHGVSLVDLSRELRALPVSNFYETISLCAFLLAALFVFIEWRYKFESLGVFLYPLIFLMTLVGATSTPVAPWSNLQIREGWLLLHVVLAVAAYATLLVTAGASVFYLMQERHLKRKAAPLVQRLPPLAILDTIVSRSMAVGFVLITLAVIMGSTWAFIEWGTRWIGEQRILLSLLTWVACLALVFLRVGAGWRGRKAALLTLTMVGFLAIAWVTHTNVRTTLLK